MSRAFTFRISILFYFTLSKNYFINYTILFYNTLNIPTFILPYDILNNIKIFLTSLSDLYFPYSLNHPQPSPPLSSFLVTPSTSWAKSITNKSSQNQNPKSIANHLPISNPNQNQKSKSITDLRSKSKIKIQNQNKKPTTDPHVWLSGTPYLAPRAYKACVGHFSNRCGTKGVKPQRSENPKDHTRGRGQILADLAPQRGQWA